MSGTNALSILLAVLLMATTAPPGQPSQLQAGEYSAPAPAHVVTWQTKRVPPPSPLYVDVDDTLNVGMESVFAGEVVTINYRLLRAADGVIVRGQFTVKAVTAYNLFTFQQQLAEGFLLSVSAKASSALTRGQTFVRVFVGAGTFGAGQPGYMLMADYVTTAMAPAFPNGRQLTPVEGPGYPHTLTVTNPAAGADWGMTTVPLGRYLVRSVIATLTTSAAVANRVPTLEVLSESLAVIARYPATVVQAAGSANLYVWSPAPTTPTTIASIAVSPLPGELILRNPQQLQAVTLNLQAGDQWSNILILVEEWLDNV